MIKCDRFQPVLALPTVICLQTACYDWIGCCAFMQLQGSKLQQQRICTQHAHSIVIPTVIKSQHKLDQKTINESSPARSTLIHVARAYQEQQPGPTPALQTYQAPLSKQLKEYRDWITEATTPPNSLDVVQLALYANRLRQVMINVPDRVRNSPAATRAAQHARLQADCTYCLQRMLSELMPRYEDLNLQQVCMVMSTIRTAHKLKWIASPPDASVSSTDADVSFTNTTHTPSQTGCYDNALEHGIVANYKTKQQLINESQQHCSQAVYTILPKLRDHAVSLIESASTPLPVKDFAFVANQLLNCGLPLPTHQRAAVAAALPLTLRSDSDLCTDAAAQLVCIVARLCGATAVVPALHILLEVLQDSSAYTRLSLASCAHLVWLTAQLRRAEGGQIERKDIPDAADTSTDTADQAGCLPQGFSWVAAWSLCAGSIRHSTNRTAALALTTSDSIPQVADSSTEPQLQTMTANANRQALWVAEWHTIQEQWLRLLDHMAQQLSVDYDEVQQASKLSHAGLLVSHWQAAGLPCTVKHAVVLAGITMPALASQPINASAALPLAQLSQLMLVTNPEEVAQAGQLQNGNVKDDSNIQHHQKGTQAPDAVLESWLQMYCSKVVEGMHHLSDAQLQYIVSHLAATQQIHPQLQLLPPLSVPTHWLAVQGTDHPSPSGSSDLSKHHQGSMDTYQDGQPGNRSSHPVARLGSNIVPTNRWHHCMHSWHEQQQAQYSVDAAGSSQSRVATSSVCDLEAAAATHLLPVMAKMHVPMSIPAIMLLAASIADYLQSCSPTIHGSSLTQPREHDNDDVDDDTIEVLPGDAQRSSLPPGSDQAASTSGIASQYIAWPLLIELLMRSITAAAVGLAESSTNLPALKAPQYIQARATAAAAEAFEHHLGNACKDLSLYPQLSKSLKFKYEHNSRHAALRLLSLMQAMQCIPGIHHIIRSGTTAAAITVAIGRVAPKMQLSELFSCLNTARSLGITPRSSTFRGTVQAAVARLIQQGALRHAQSGESSPRVLSPVIKLLRVFKDFRMTLGPRVEDILTAELLSYQLQGQMTIPFECRKCKLEQTPSVVSVRSGKKNADDPDSENQPTNIDTVADLVETGLNSDQQLGFHTCHAVQLPAGYVLDKELVQLLKLMATVPFMADERLTDKLQTLVQASAEAGRLRAKYVAACITSLKKLGFLAKPAVLAALLKAGLLVTTRSSAQKGANGRASIQVANRGHTPMTTGSITHETREEHQQSVTINMADYRAVMMALDNVKYPGGSSAQAYLRDIIVTMQKITQHQATGSKPPTRVLRKVAGRIETHIARLAAASTDPGTARAPPSGRPAGSVINLPGPRTAQAVDGDDVTGSANDPLDSFIASQLAALRAKQDSSNE